MPNHITNVIEFHCDDDRFREIAEFLRGSMTDEPLGTVDFNVLIPMPESLQIESGTVGARGLDIYRRFMNEIKGSASGNRAEIEAKFKQELNDDEAWDLGKQYYENILEHGFPTWYEWAYKNWGTKWNAYDCEPADFDRHRLSFLTAWCGVPDILKKISEKFPEVSIGYAWADEDIGSNVGVIEYKDGVEVEWFIPKSGTKEAFELAAEILEDDLADMGFVEAADGSTYHFDMDALGNRESETPAKDDEAR